MVPFYEHKTTLLQSRREHDALNFPLHLHICPELIYIEAGNVTLNFIGHSYPMREGDFAVIFPHTVHGYFTVSKSEDTDYLLAISQIEACGEFKDILLSHHPENPVISASNLHSDIPRMMRELVGIADAEKQGLLIKSLIQLILARTMPEMKLNHNTARFQSDVTVRVISYVSENYRKKIDLESVSKKLGISRFCLSRIFNEKVHIGFVAYINYLRIEYSKNLLKTTDLSILEVALESGFDNLRTFNRVFKAACNTTPLQYRRQ